MKLNDRYFMKSLNDPNEIEEHLALTLLSDDISEFVFALYNVVLAKKAFAELANHLGITKEGLLKILRPDGNPHFSTIRKIVRYLGCDFSIKKNIFKQKDRPYIISLFSLAETNPDLVVQWHMSKNSPLNPTKVRSDSKRVVWWQCPIVDAHEWKEAISIRVRGEGCPYCSGSDPMTYKSLQNKCPDLAKQWHLALNKELSSSDVTSGSNKKVWWKCAGDHIWEATVANRVNGQQCPFCRKSKALNGNCLADACPALALEWSYALNKDLSPNAVTAGSNKKVWWQCKIDRTHQWKAMIVSRTKGTGCPFCSNKKVSRDNCLATSHPELTKQWHSSKNGDLSPKDVLAGSNKKCWWVCLKSIEHEWQASVVKRVHGRGCPVCAKEENVNRFKNILARNDL